MVGVPGAKFWSERADESPGVSRWENAAEKAEVAGSIPVASTGSASPRHRMVRRGIRLKT